jgi:hypothetical protein
VKGMARVIPGHKVHHGLYAPLANT